ncbi:MAG TPA: DNA helicase [Ideonella sp.]|uniref:DNA helicase n=1 Tax=Ideonella sp. TaxID=1929293 RepID=UPI002BB4D2F2|nr:DNA helicase [Ideonella sp.]HSI47754.1 DNA helicase [Ideonella sp.]
MKLSAPIHVLKQQAKALSRQENIRLHAALDCIAVREGFNAWSHLAARWQPGSPGAALFAQLQSGDLVLVGSRPGQGKTLLAIGLAIEAMQQRQHAALFTLEFTAADVARCFGLLGHDLADFGERFVLDLSERISAGHIATRLADAPPRTLVVIDYLQLLDQPREHPPLDQQVRTLKAFAQARQAIVVCLSQISRGYEGTGRPCPDLADVRLPNPVDLSLFSKACFLHNGKMQLVVGS